MMSIVITHTPTISTTRLNYIFANIDVDVLANLQRLAHLSEPKYTLYRSIRQCPCHANIQSIVTGSCYSGSRRTSQIVHFLVFHITEQSSE